MIKNTSHTSTQSQPLKFVRFFSKNLLIHIYLFAFIFLCAALSIANNPLFPQELWLPLILPCAMISLIYFPKSTTPHLLLAGFWMDHILMFVPMVHISFIFLMFLAIKALETFSKQYTFLSHWGVFSFLTFLYFAGTSLFSEHLMSKDIIFSFILTIFSFSLLLGAFRSLLSPAMRLAPKRA